MSVVLAKSLKILMIEDDRDLCEGWLDVFTLLGHELQCFQKALLAVADESAVKSCDLVITDFYLPDINGVELISRIRKINERVPVILLTGSREASIVDSIKKMSHCSLMHKPLNISEIEKKIDSLFAA